MPPEIEPATTQLVPIIEVEGTIKGQAVVAEFPIKCVEDDPLILREQQVITFRRVHKGKRPSEIIDFEIGIKEKAVTDRAKEEGKFPLTPAVASNLAHPHK